MSNETDWPIVTDEYWLEPWRGKSWCLSCRAWLPRIVYLAEEAHCKDSCQPKTAAAATESPAIIAPTIKPTRQRKAKPVPKEQLGFDL